MVMWPPLQISQHTLQILFTKLLCIVVGYISKTVPKHLLITEPVVSNSRTTNNIEKTYQLKTGYKARQGLNITDSHHRFNGHFPGEPGLAGVYWSKGWWKWWWQMDYWSYKLYKSPVESSPPTNQHPVFYRPDALPVAQLTVSKHWRENITFNGLADPKLSWGFPTLSLTTNSWLPCLSSVLWCQYPLNIM